MCLHWRTCAASFFQELLNWLILHPMSLNRGINGAGPRKWMLKEENESKWHKQRTKKLPVFPRISGHQIKSQEKIRYTMRVICFIAFQRMFLGLFLHYIDRHSPYMTVSRLESNQIICQQSLNQPNWTRLHLSADAEKEALKTQHITDLKYIHTKYATLTTRCSIHCRQYLRGSILLCKTYWRRKEANKKGTLSRA